MYAFLLWRYVSLCIINSNGIAARRYKFSRYGFLVQTILPDGPATEYVQVYEYHPR